LPLRSSFVILNSSFHSMSAFSDPFKEARAESGVMQCPFHGENITMILRHEDVRKASKDWQTFSSNVPFRVPIPSEEDVRSMRQLPIETDPPEHGDYRAIAEPFFQRAKEPEMMAKVESLLESLLTQALGSESVEIVNEFALPVQSRALTYLLNTSENEANTWIGWGIHVFKVTGGEFKKGTVLEDYLHQKFDEAEANPGGADFFTALTTAEYRGRKLTVTPSFTPSPAPSAISASTRRRSNSSAPIPNASHSPARSFSASSCHSPTSAASVRRTPT